MLVPSQISNNNKIFLGRVGAPRGSLCPFCSKFELSNLEQSKMYTMHTLSKTSKQLICFSFLLFLGSLIFLISPALAGEDVLGTDYGRHTGLGKRDVRETIATIIRILLGLLGMVSLVFIIYAGFTWMTAGGNEEKVTTAKKTLWAAIIGLVIIMSAYSIMNFVFSNLWFATTGYQYR